MTSLIQLKLLLLYRSTVTWRFDIRLYAR